MLQRQFLEYSTIRSLDNKLPENKTQETDLQASTDAEIYLDIIKVLSKSQRADISDISL